MQPAAYPAAPTRPYSAQPPDRRFHRWPPPRLIPFSLSCSPQLPSPPAALPLLPPSPSPFQADGRIDSSNLEDRNQHFVAILAQSTRPPAKPASFSSTPGPPASRPPAPSTPLGTIPASSQSLPAHLPSQRSPGLAGPFPDKIRSAVSLHGGEALPRPSLECVFLNSCESATLGRAIAHGLSHDVVVICWSSLTEDTAAREFAQVGGGCGVCVWEAGRVGGW
jgi:hypothetical protein